MANIKITKELFQKVQSPEQGDSQYRVDRFKIGTDAELVDIALLNKEDGDATVYGNDYNPEQKYEFDENEKIVRQDLASYQHDFEQYVIDRLDNITVNSDERPSDDSKNTVQSDGIYDTIVGAEQLLKSTVGWTTKNLVPAMESKTAQGLTYTVNEDNSVLVNGTAQETPTVLQVGFDIPPVGKYILTGCPKDLPEGGRLDIIVNESEDNQRNYNDFGDGVIVDIKSDDTKIKCRIRFETGNIVENQIFYPMLRSFDVLDPSYEPYHITVKQAIDQVLGVRVNSIVNDNILEFTDPVITAESVIDGPYIQDTLMAISALESNTNYLKYTLFNGDADTKKAYIWVREV